MAEKYYYGSFDRDATLDVKADAHGVHIDLDRRVGERRHVGIHLHFYLLAEVIEGLASVLRKKDLMNQSQRAAVECAVAKLDKALHPPARRK